MSKLQAPDDDRQVCDYPTCSKRGSGHPLACGCRSATALPKAAPLDILHLDGGWWKLTARRVFIGWRVHQSSQDGTTESYWQLREPRMAAGAQEGSEAELSKDAGPTWNEGGKEAVFQKRAITMTHDDLMDRLGDGAHLITDAGFVLVPRTWREDAMKALRQGGAS